MDSERLEEACELAGGQYLDYWDEWEFRTHNEKYLYRVHDPALPAYVASLLPLRSAGISRRRISVKSMRC